MYLYEAHTNLVKEMYLSEIAQLTNISESEIVKKSYRFGYLESINCYVSTQPFTFKKRKELYANTKYESECWVELKDIENHFISNYGRIKKVINGKETMRLPNLNKNGAKQMRLNYKGSVSPTRVARLVAEHFLEPRKEENYVLNHKNGIKTDDFVGNLEWVERKTLAKMVGQRARSKRVVLIDKETGRIIETFTSTKDASRKKKYGNRTIGDLCKGKSKIRRNELFLYEEDYKSMENDFLMRNTEITGENVLNYLKIFNKIQI